MPQLPLGSVQEVPLQRTSVWFCHFLSGTLLTVLVGLAFRLQHQHVFTHISLCKATLLQPTVQFISSKHRSGPHRTSPGSMVSFPTRQRLQQRNGLLSRDFSPCVQEWQRSPKSKRTIQDPLLRTSLIR